MNQLLQNRKLLFIGIGAAGLLLLIVLISLSVSRSGGLSLERTDPENGGTPHQYATVSFTFNKPLAFATGSINQISFKPAIAGKTTVSGETATFKPTVPFETGIKYTATLSGIKGKDGETTGDVTLIFTPQYTAWADLPEDVRKELTIDDEDVDRPYFAGNIAIAGSRSITERGVTEEQLELLKIAFYRYFKSVNQEERALAASNITKIPHDPNSRTLSDTLKFDVYIGDKLAYKATLVYMNLTQVRLYLHNPKTGAQIYDSKVIDENTPGDGHD